MPRLLQGGQFNPVTSPNMIDQGTAIPQAFDFVSNVAGLTPYPGQAWEITTIKVQIKIAITSIDQITIGNNVLCTVSVGGFAIGQVPMTLVGTPAFNGGSYTGILTLSTPAEVLAGDSFTVETTFTTTSNAAGANETATLTGGLTLIGTRDAAQ